MAQRPFSRSKTKIVTFIEHGQSGVKLSPCVLAHVDSEIVLTVRSVIISPTAPHSSQW